ncbi:MAG: helix-turn-helix domain-containing protein [Terrimesophilobacter sp.]
MTARRPPMYRTLASLSRVNLLRELQSRGTLTVEELAAATGLHHNTAREHLHRLIADGFVTCEPEGKDTKGRPRMLYSVANDPAHRNDPIQAAKVTAALRRADQVRQLLHADETLAPDSPLSRQVDVLDDHLDRTGFDARVETDELQVQLHNCPFSDLARQHPQVCLVHFGLLKGILEQVGGPLVAEELHPFVHPHSCTLDLCCPESPAAESEPRRA